MVVLTFITHPWPAPSLSSRFDTLCPNRHRNGGVPYVKPCRHYPAIMATGSTDVNNQHIADVNDQPISDVNNHPIAKVNNQPVADVNTSEINNANLKTFCGFATLMGPSNSGKSTLVNHLVGYKVAIVTPKVQTTRCRISGIATYTTTQVIFLDTPGIFEPNNRLARAMVKSAWKSSRDGDVVALILDGLKLHRNLSSQRRQEADGNGDLDPESLQIPPDIESVMEGLQRARERGRATKLCVCTNKMDAIRPQQHSKVLKNVTRMLERYDLPSESIPIFPISARTGENVELFRQWVVDRMPRGPWLYEDDDMTDMSARQLAEEVSREKAFLLLNQELPYEIAVETTSYKQLDNGSIRITQDILVARESQKRIVTGQGGSVIKEIGSRARADLGEILGTTVHLMLTVKVRGKWKEEKSQYQRWGLDFNA